MLQPARAKVIASANRTGTVYPEVEMHRIMERAGLNSPPSIRNQHT